MFLFDPLSEKRMYSYKEDIHGISRGGYHVSWVRSKKFNNSVSVSIWDMKIWL